MASSYTGICLHRDPSTGDVTDVQVTDSGGNELPLPIHDYIARGVTPAWETLPDCSSVLKTD
jgi:hypothetical protein